MDHKTSDQAQHNTNQSSRNKFKTVYVDEHGFLMRKLAKRGDRLSRDLQRLAVEVDKLHDYLKKYDATSVKPFDRSADVLKRIVYAIGAHVLRYEQEETLVRTVWKLNTQDKLRAIHKNAPRPSVNPFFWVYHLILGDQKKISRDQRSKSARQLLYAYQHRVPVEFLTGFIYQTGYREAPKAGDDGYREVWHHSQKA